MERRGWQDKAGCKVTPTAHSSRMEVSQAFIWFTVKARQTDTIFNNLLHQIDVTLLRCAFNSLGKSKAKGVDGITKSRYGENLELNLADLHARIHENQYRTKPSRVIQIPKANGKLRPIAISTIEDKIVQRAVTMILETIYEPVFLDSSLGACRSILQKRKFQWRRLSEEDEQKNRRRSCSYVDGFFAKSDEAGRMPMKFAAGEYSDRLLGFRPKRGCHKAIQKVYQLLGSGRRPYVIDVDIEKFFNSMNHKRLMEFLRLKINDRRFLHLVGKLLRTMVREDGLDVINEVGSPQGSIVSPILANIYLHYVLDEWFEKIGAGHYQRMVRYADDVIFCFRDEDKAREFKPTLQKRLEEYGLGLNEEKTKIVLFEKGAHEAFHFLGFTFYWGKDRKRNVYLKVKTQAEKLRMKLAEIKVWLKKIRNRMSLNNIISELKMKLSGHYAYYGIETNSKTWVFYNLCLKLLFKWINRRSQKRSYSWKGFMDRLKHSPLPKPFLANKFSFAQDIFAFAI